MRLNARVFYFLIFSMFTLLHVMATLHFRDSFPGSWSWGELLVNYQGGFTKRAFFGNLVYQLRDVLSPKEFVSASILCVYISATTIMIYILQIQKGFAGLLFLFSPLGWLYPLLVPAAYGRKDAFVALACSASLAIILRSTNQFGALLITAVLFFFTGLIVEIAWLYYPLIIAACLCRWRAEPIMRKLQISLLGGLYVALCLGWTLSLKHVDTAAISASWAPLPLPDNGGSALCCLNFDLRTALATGRAAWPNLGGYALAELFGLIPLVLLITERVRRLVDLAGASALVLAALLATTPVFVAADWGRYLYLWTFCIFTTVWTVCHSRDDPREDLKLTWATAAPRILAVALYATTWQTVHYQFPDRSAFIPGAVFRAIGASTIAPFTQ